MPDFISTFNKQSNPLLKLNDRLRYALKDRKGINVSTIILVGDQSNGKTSVIEGLTGLALPRGNNVQTRAPTELRIKCADSVEEESYSVSYRKDDEEISFPFDLESMEKTIRAAQTDLIGDENDITDEPIYVHINKYNQEELTIIDLPGVTRALLKSQHSDVEGKILNMYRNYMRPEETIIVNVVSAMVDFSTSASLKLSNEFDEDAMRTIVCITKIDQHKEKGLKSKIDYALKTLKINENHLFLIRNRTQDEILNQVSIEDTRQREKELLKENEELKDYPESMKGIASLSKKLIDIQEKHISKTMMTNYEKLENMKQECENEKLKLGRAYTTEYECLIEIQQRFNQIFDDIKKHHMCLSVSDTWFKELKFESSLNNAKTFELMAFNSIKIEGALNSIKTPEEIKLKSNASCNVTVEFRAAKKTFIKQVDLMANVESIVKFSEFQLPYFVKIIVVKANAIGNKFLPFWDKESRLHNNIHEKYAIEYFLNSFFLDFLNAESRKSGKGFGLTAPSLERISEHVLKQRILPSTQKDSENYIEDICSMIMNIYKAAIKEKFDDVPFLKSHLLITTSEYFENLKNNAFEYYNELYEWLGVCPYADEETNKYCNEIMSYIETFLKDHNSLLTNNVYPYGIVYKHMNPIDSCTACAQLNKEEKAVAVSPILQFDLHYLPNSEYLLKIADNNIRILKISLNIWTQWKNTTKTLLTMLKQMARNFFVNKPLANLQDFLLKSENYGEYTLMELMKPSEIIAKKRKDNDKFLDDIHDILKEMKALKVRVEFNDFDVF